jgi:hypothetical protein
MRLAAALLTMAASVVALGHQHDRPALTGSAPVAASDAPLRVTHPSRSERRRPLAAPRHRPHRSRRSQRVLHDWSGVARCESGGNWSIATGNGFYGGLQFALSTWRAFGGVGLPNVQPAAAQIAVAERVLAAQGIGAWPVCGAYLRTVAR